MNRIILFIETHRENLNLILLIAIILVFTFPKYEPDYGVGLDTSYMWALNHLFIKNYDFLKTAIFPIGILGFLKHPTVEGYSYLLHLIFFCLLKIEYLRLFLTNQQKPIKLDIILLALFSSYFLILDSLIIFICLFYVLNAINNKANHYLYIACGLATIGYLIKPTIGIASGSIPIIYLIYQLWNGNSFKSIAKTLTIFTVIVGSIAMLFFQSLASFFNYFLNSVYIVKNYSSALGLYPENNWWLIALYLVSFGYSFLFIRKIKTLPNLLLIPAFFLMWKHSFSREDLPHIIHLLSFTIIYWCYLISQLENKKTLVFLIALINIGSYTINITNVKDYRKKEFDFLGIINFKDAIYNFTETKKHYINITNEAIQSSKLDPKIRAIIGDSTIDSFPWELSYIYANDLNWKPRKTIQVTVFSSWLDSLTAIEFTRKKGPEYILLHYTKSKLGGELSSIDGKYFMNDNPKTFQNILNYYDLHTKHQDYLLFKKNTKNNLSTPISESAKKYAWNKWIPVPTTKKNTITRLKIKSETSLPGQLIKLIYKPAPLFIDYKLTDSSLVTFRYTKSTAEDGLWINPFIRYPSSELTEKNVIGVRIRNDQGIQYSDHVTIQFEHIPVTSKTLVKTNFNSANLLLGKKSPLIDSILIHEKTLPLEKTIPAEGYSAPFSYDLKEIWNTLDPRYTSIEITVSAFCLNHSPARIVLEDRAAQAFWDETRIPQSTSWEPSVLTKKIYRDQNFYSYAFIWNQGKKPLKIKHFNILVKALRQE